VNVYVHQNKAEARMERSTKGPAWEPLSNRHKRGVASRNRKKASTVTIMTDHALSYDVRRVYQEK
jgi:hypothetical protein